MLGVAAASSLPRPARLAVLGGVAGLTAASEKVSFTKVIARTPPLHWLDMLGRRPAPGGASRRRRSRQRPILSSRPQAACRLTVTPASPRQRPTPRIRCDHTGRPR